MLTMEPKDQLADKPQEIDNGSDDGETEKGLFVIVYYFHFYCVYFQFAATYIIKDEF